MIWELAMLCNICWDWFSNTMMTSIETIMLHDNRGLSIMVLLDSFCNVFEFEFCRLFGLHQAANKPISCWTTDTKEYSSLLVCIYFNFVSCKVLFQALNIHSKKHHERRKFRISSYFLVYKEHGFARNHESVYYRKQCSDVDYWRRHHLQWTDHKILS